MEKIVDNEVFSEVRKRLFEHFYYDFLLEQLRLYVSQKYDLGFDDYKQVYMAVDNFSIKDKILVETFMEVGYESYWPLFRDMKIMDKNLVKYSDIYKECKSFFDNLHLIDDLDNKFDQWFKFFSLIGPYFQMCLEDEGFLPEDYNANL